MTVVLQSSDPETDPAAQELLQLITAKGNHRREVERLEGLLKTHVEVPVEH